MSFPLTRDEITINLQMLYRQWRRRRATSFSREYKSYDRRRVVVCGADRGAGKEMRSNRFPLESARMEHTHTHTHSRWVRSHPVCCFAIVWSRWISLWMAGPWRFLLGTCWTQSETFQIGKSFSHTIASEWFLTQETGTHFNGLIPTAIGQQKNRIRLAIPAEKSLRWPQQLVTLSSVTY